MVEEKTKKIEEEKKMETKKPVEKAEEKTKEVKKEGKPKTSTPKVKKEEAVVNAQSLPISTKVSRDICKFIKWKKIDETIKMLGEVERGKIAVPMKGEIPHRKGPIMSGRFPKNAAKEFIVILKGLNGNAIVNGLDEPVIVEAIANMAARPYGKFGRVKRKRTHVKLVAREKKMSKKKKSGGKK